VSSKDVRRIQLDPSRYERRDTWTSPNVLRIVCRYLGHETRFGIGYVGRNGACRREQDGPILPGPYAYLIPLPVVIAAHDGGTAAESARLAAAGIEWDAADGDELIIGGERFTIEDDHRSIPMRYPRLVHLGATPGQRPDED
jgi:hypothetical protein